MIKSSLLLSSIYLHIRREGDVWHLRRMVGEGLRVYVIKNIEGEVPTSTIIETSFKIFGDF